MNDTDALSSRVANLNGLQQAFSSRFCAVDFRADHSEPTFDGRFENYHLGDLELFNYRGMAVRNVVRSTRQIHRDPADDYLVMLPLNIALDISQDSRQCAVTPGHIGLLKTSAPFAAGIDKASGVLQEEIVLKIPGSQLRQAVPHIDDCCAVPIDLQRSSGRILQSMINAVLIEASAVNATQGSRLAAMLTQLVAMTALDADLPHAAVGRRERTNARIRVMAQAYIEQHIASPMLTPTAIAAHCRVALRTLHAAFESAEESVAATIRNARLQRCREDLCNPALRHQPIFRIAMHWGFTNPDHFSQAYRAHFGITPRAERKTRN